MVASAVGLAAILSALSADLARVVSARTHAQAAADAAALAAAQELLVPSALSPSEVAEDYAARHGATVIECRCERSSDDVLVGVELPVTLPFVGRVSTVGARARAVVESAEMLGLDPGFAAGLRCLFSKVAGLTIVSGFRTHAEQAQLYAEKPQLAAPPGHSKHEVGLAADLGYPSETAREHAHAEAPSCGLGFPVSHEPWHIEPIGTEG